MRRLDRLVALLLGLALAGAAVIAGIETMLLVLGQPSLVIPRATWGAALSPLQWSNSTLEVIAGCLTAGGALVLLAQLAPRRRVRLLLRQGAHAGTWLSRKGLNRKVAYDVLQLREVDKASAKVGRRRVHLRVRLAAGIDEATGRAQAAAVADATLAHWPLLDPLKVAVKAKATPLPTTPNGRTDGTNRVTPARAS